MTTTPHPTSGNPLLAIFAVCSALVSSTDYSQMLHDVVASIGRAMDVSSCDLQTYHADRDACIYEAYWSIDGVTAGDLDYLGTVSTISERPDLRAILDSPVPFEQHVDDPEISEADLANIVEWGYKSTLDVPLRVGDDEVGLLGVQEKRFTRRFTRTERDLFRWLCELAGLGIHNAGVMRRQTERGRHLTSLLSIGDALTDVIGRQEAFDTLVRVAAATFGAPRSILYEYDPSAETLTMRGIFPPETDSEVYTIGVPRTLEEAAIVPEALTDRSPVVETLSDPEYFDDVLRADLVACDEKTCISIPVVYRGKTLGVLLILWTKYEHFVTADELALASGVGQVAAIALRRTQLLEEGGGATAHEAPSGPTPLPQSPLPPPPLPSFGDKP